MKRVIDTNFETVDWDAEALRVARAFGVVGECAFVRDSDGCYVLHLLPTRSTLADPFWKRWFRPRLPEKSTPLLTPTGLELFVHYQQTANMIEAFFALDDDDRRPLAYLDRTAVPILVSLDGSTFTNYSQINPHLYSEQMAKGLYHLDLLMPEVEEALKVNISAHEKLEWALEYETRYGL